MSFGKKIRYAGGWGAPITGYEGSTLAGYDGPTRPSTLPAFWAEHREHDVRYGRGDFSVVTQVDCRDCPGALYFLSMLERLEALTDSANGGLFFRVVEDE